MMKSLAEVVRFKDEPYQPQPHCQNCNDKRRVSVNVRANEMRLIDCPVCQKTYITEGELSHA